MMRVDSRNAASKSGNGYVTGRHRTEQRQPWTHRRQPRAREANGSSAVGGVVRQVGEAGAPRLLHANVELVEGLLGDAASGRSADARCVQRPASRSADRSAKRASTAGSWSTAIPSRLMPVSTLMCTSIRPPAPGGRRAEPFEVTYVVDDGRQALADDVVLVPVVVGAEDEDRGPDPRRPQLEPLLHQRYRQGVAQRLQRAGHRHRAVPVSVGLDHPEHGDRRPDQPRETGTGSVWTAPRSISATVGRMEVRMSTSAKRDKRPLCRVPAALGLLAKPCKVSPAYGVASINYARTQS